MAKITAKKALILTSLCAEIAEVEHSRGHLEALIARYVPEQGLKVTMRNGMGLVRMHSIEGTSPESDAKALASWSRAARRAMLNAGVS